MDLSNYEEELKIAVQTYCPNFYELDEVKQEKLINEILSSKQKYGFSHYNEYFKYGFAEKNEEQRATFCGGQEYENWCRNSVDESKIGLIFKDKFYTYNVLQDYYKRDVIKVSGFEDYAIFAQFVAKHREFIVKDLCGSLGANISRYVVGENDSIRTLFFSVLQHGDCVCEEWIKQSDQMACFNEESVNTVRVVTMYDGSKLEKIYAMFRTGRNKMTVDNASMGGIACGVDIESGVVFSDGYTKKNEHFEAHPDVNIKFCGFQIPRWNEIFPMLEKMHKLCTESKIVGWDLALTDDGWVLVEGNGKPNIDTIQLIYNRTYNHGLRDVLEKTIGRYK